MSPDHRDMLDEYDFSQGVRGKYAEHYLSDPDAGEDERHADSLRSELTKLSCDQAAHIEKEFEGYDRKYPLE